MNTLNQYINQLNAVIKVENTRCTIDKVKHLNTNIESIKYTYRSQLDKSACITITRDIKGNNVDPYNIDIREHQSFYLTANLILYYPNNNSRDERSNAQKKYVFAGKTLQVYKEYEVPSLNKIVYYDIEKYANLGDYIFIDKYYEDNIEVGIKITVNGWNKNDIANYTNIINNSDNKSYKSIVYFEKYLTKIYDTIFDSNINESAID
jgi:hypothetical protein